MDPSSVKTENEKAGRGLLIKGAAVCVLMLMAVPLMTIIVWIIATRQDYLDKNQIFSAVQENQVMLRECVLGNDPEQAKQIRGIQSVRYDADEDYYEFSCGGAGIVPASSYYGFYYSPKDAPLAVDVTQTENLSPVQDGYGWREPKGDNSYYTERIMENWYYYESHY